MEMTPNQIKRALEVALKEQNPELFNSLKQAGTLEETLRPLVGRAEASIEEMRQQAIEAATTEGNPGFVANPQERIQTLNSQFLAAEEVALKQAVEELGSLQAA